MAKNISGPIAITRPFHPVKFLMWLYIGSMAMIFAGFSSALIVSMADNIKNGSWVHFSLPSVFSINTVIIVLSSITFHLAYLAAKRNQFGRLQIFLFVTLLIGIGFLTGQYIAFNHLYANGVLLVDNAQKIGNTHQVFNNSGAFVYIITGAHGLHIIGGVIALMVMLFQGLRYKINETNLLGMQLTGYFWHALGVLWIYLFVFLSTIYS